MDTPNQMSQQVGQSTEQNPMSPMHHGHAKTIISMIVIIILLAGVFIVVKHPDLLSKYKKFSTENVVLNENDKIIPGDEFLKLVPIETNNIEQNSTLTYPDRGEILYSISYTSAKQMEELYMIYGEFLKQSGFHIDSTTKSPTIMNYGASRGGEKFSVVISVQTPLQNLVQVGYLTKK